MKIVLEGDTVDTLLTELDMATTLLRGAGGAVPVASRVTQATTAPVPPPPAVAATAAETEPPKPSGAGPTKRKRRSKEQKAFDDAHGISLKERKKIDEMRDGDPNLTDEQALALVRGGAAPTPQPAEQPVPAAPVTLPGVPATPPANPMAALTIPGAAPGVPVLQEDGSIAPAPSNEMPPIPPELQRAPPPPAPAAQPVFDLPQHANPAPGTPITDAMLQNAFVALQSNVSTDAALQVLSESGHTQIGDIPMEDRQAVVDKIDGMVRAAG